MTNDGIEWKGGPQPVADDVFVEVCATVDYTVNLDDGLQLSQFAPWARKFKYRILNQHLIDAARLEGIRLGLEAAARLAEEESGNLSTTGRVLQSFGSRSSTTVLFTDKGIGSAIRALNPDTIAKEADNEPR